VEHSRGGGEIHCNRGRTSRKYLIWASRTDGSFIVERKGDIQETGGKVIAESLFPQEKDPWQEVRSREGRNVLPNAKVDLPVPGETV